jgi:hypothetical protein
VRTSHLASSLYLLVLGLGIGLFLQVMVLIVQNTAAPRDLGTATSSVNFARQVGSSAGVALIGAPFIHRLDGHLAARVPASGAGHLRAAQVSSITPHGLAQVPPPPARHRRSVRRRAPAHLRVPDSAAGRGIRAHADAEGDPAAQPPPAWAQDRPPRCRPTGLHGRAVTPSPAAAAG